jgi:exopolyphosphatase/guanosine-5'-triphosphate,3'-diphosphate pyrophosphatase
MKVRKFAAIDIGSNAMRLLITNVVEQPNKTVLFNKSSLIRVPIRLGEDVFTIGEITVEKRDRMIDAMKAFSLLMKVYQVENYRACATSAMRESENGADVVEDILNQTAIKVDIINGLTEAKIIAKTDLLTFISTNKNYLYIDVGGGSTEFSLFVNGEIVASKSFKNGTVRMLQTGENQDINSTIKSWIKEQCKGLEEIELIGSGGNINKIFKLSGKVQSRPLTLGYLQNQLKILSALSYEQRITDFQLNPDRADVIVPALSIYVNAMKWSHAKRIYVPKIGLSDGIIKAMYFGEI